MEEKRYIDPVLDEETGEVVGYLHTTHVITDPAINALRFGTAHLTDYSNMEVRWKQP